MLVNLDQVVLEDGRTSIRFCSGVMKLEFPILIGELEGRSCIQSDYTLFPAVPSALCRYMSQIHVYLLLRFCVVRIACTASLFFQL